MRILFLLALATPALAQVTINMQPADHVMIPGSTRSLYVDVQGTPDMTVKWTVTGGCTLASATTSAAPEVVTAPSAGGECKFQTAVPTNQVPSFSSPVSCTITATSASDATASASIVIPVCDPPVFLSTFPTSTVLFKNQFAVIQSNVRGNQNTGVSWAITSNPGGAGQLTGGTSNRHAVFSATAPGTYVLTATSSADSRKKASSVIYVTPHDLPGPNADHTEPVDCTAVGSGKTLEVGPDHPFKDLNAVSWNSLKAGDTVRIHNDDTTGSAPTAYHQKVAILVSGSPTQPIRVCGVPDAKGLKPIVDGENATTRPDADWGHGGSLETYGIFSLYDAFHKFDTTPNGNQNIVIEGLHIRNANATFNFINQAKGVPTPYGNAAACVRVQTGRGVLIRGNELDRCSQAVFTNATTPEGGIIYDLTIEGNYIHEWGVPKVERQHAMYLQALGLVVQFNYFGAALAEVPGNVIKSRSVLNFLRWNYIAQTASTARAFDLVEPQSFACTIIPFKFAYSYHGMNAAKTDCYTPRGGAGADPLPANQVAANYEAYRSDYVYGNIMNDDGSASAFVHYGFDQQTVNGGAYDRRAGTLYYWNNTHLTRKPSGVKWIFDLSSPDFGKSYEYATVQSLNNVFATAGAAPYLWTRALWTQIAVDSTWISSGHVLPNRASKDSYQGAIPLAAATACDKYFQCKPGNGHMIWQRGGKPGTAAASLYVGATPFNPDTFLPTAKIRGLAAPLPRAIEDQPSNMEYFPATNTITPRKDASYLGALD